MSAIESNRPVVMVRPHLDGLLSARMPEGFTVHWFTPGYEQSWLKIHQQTERYRRITSVTFEEQFGSNPVLLSQRQCFLLDPAGKAIGTGTAWFDVDGAKSSRGRVHWLAVLPQFQGRGLGEVLLAVLCQRLKELGHTSAFLRTSSGRLAAIALYLKFGFVPVTRDAEEAALWKQLIAALSDIRPR